jgi:hypothetical protein
MSGLSVRYPCCMNNADNKAPGRWLYIAGGVLTLLYLVVLASYCVDQWSEVRGMQPNNLGDFLAGAFSPMAFAWLVLGFIQQGIELRQNSAALILQAEELRSAATHAGAMVELQRKEFELRIQELEETRQKADAAQMAAAKRREEQEVRNMQPRFSFSLAHRDHQNQHVAKSNLTNGGPGCTNVKIVMMPIPDVLELTGSTDFTEFPMKLQQPIVFGSYDAVPRTHPLTVQYTDSGGTERFQKFIVSVNENCLYIDQVND